MLNLEMALLMMQHQQFIVVPFVTEQNPRKAIRNVQINAVGFWGNAVSVLLSRPWFKTTFKTTFIFLTAKVTKFYTKHAKQLMFFVPS